MVLQNTIVNTPTPFTFIPINDDDDYLKKILDKNYWIGTMIYILR
jgi:uncharacterized membrane protein